LLAAAGGEAKNIEVGKIAQPLPGEGRGRPVLASANSSAVAGMDQR
jgi:hypothetical protein